MPGFITDRLRSLVRSTAEAIVGACERIAIGVPSAAAVSEGARFERVPRVSEKGGEFTPRFVANGHPHTPKERESIQPAEARTPLHDEPEPAFDTADLPDLKSDPLFLREFVIEARDLLESAEVHLLQFEGGSDPAGLTNNILRSFHTIKGGARLFGLSTVTALAHDAESLLAAVREGRLVATSETVEMLLQCVDALNALVEQLDAYSESATRVAGVPPSVMETRNRLSTFLARVPVHPIRPPLVTADASSKSQEPAESWIKVPPLKLDAIVALTNDIGTLYSLALATRGAARHEHMAALSRAAVELRRIALTLRTAPMRSLFVRMRRLVHDLARTTGKQIDVQIEGANLQVDRDRVEAISAAVGHLVRNAVDHGIEPASQRLSAGKSRRGLVRITARQQGSELQIKVGDDGTGLDKQRLRTRAVELGLIEPDATLSDDELSALILEPGFTTAPSLTTVSGRGVGMDAVRETVLNFGGRIEIESVPGQGTCFTIRLPTSSRPAPDIRTQFEPRFTPPVVQRQPQPRGLIVSDFGPLTFKPPITHHESAPC